MAPRSPARAAHPTAGTLAGWGLELSMALALLALGAGLAHRWGPWAGAAGLAVLLAAIACTPSLRRRLGSLLAGSALRRRWRRAVGALGPGLLAACPPVILGVRRAPVGEQLLVALPPGSHPGELEAGADRLATALGAREVRIEREAANAARAVVTVVYRDPLATQDALTWPRAGAGQVSIWDPVPVGLDENGHEVTLGLPERNVLLGGEPGAGKSAALSLLVASAALDPTCALWLLDGKLVELAAWAKVAAGSAGVDPAEAIELLAHLQAEMDARYATLLATGARKVTPGAGLGLHVVVVDELAHYLTTGDRRQRGEIADRLRDLVSRGRAAGIVVLAATQKPSTDIVPSSLRDLFGFRWALRCATAQASDTILGSGWAARGYSAATIDAAHRGVGWLLHEGGTPVRLRSFYVDDAALAALATRAGALRQQDRPRAPQADPAPAWAPPGLPGAPALVPPAGGLPGEHW